MRVFTVILLMFVGLGLSSCLRPTAKAQLVDAKGNPVGQAQFFETEAGVTMRIEAKGLSAGPHGMHIHGVGKCEGPDFQSAGPHFNPHGKKHGLKNPEGHHSGDLPNLIADDQGSAKAEFLLKHVSLKENAQGSLFNAEGTSVVIHAGPDDETTDPTGNSGGRIVCGVIEKV